MTVHGKATCIVCDTVGTWSEDGADIDGGFIMGSAFDGRPICDTCEADRHRAMDAEIHAEFYSNDSEEVTK